MIENIKRFAKKIFETKHGRAEPSRAEPEALPDPMASQTAKALSVGPSRSSRRPPSQDGRGWGRPTAAHASGCPKEPTTAGTAGNGEADATSKGRLPVPAPALAAPGRVSTTHSHRAPVHHAAGRCWPRHRGVTPVLWCAGHSNMHASLPSPAR